MKKIYRKNLEILIFIPFLILGLISIYAFNSKVEEFRLNKDKFEEIARVENNKPKIKLVSENGKTVKFNISINDSQISPEIIEVEKGSLVVLNVEVLEGYHNIFVDRYNVETRGIPTDQSDTLIFVASLSGRFNLSSSTDMYEKEPTEALLIVK